MKRGAVYFHKMRAGYVEEDDEGYRFYYTDSFLQSSNPAISVTLPKQKEPFTSPVLFSFFDGLIPEGWLLEIAMDTWKIDLRDRMELLLVSCKDVIGAVSIERIPDG